MQRIAQKLILAGIFLLGLVTFFTGINWGLPSRDSDLFLFGSHKPWTGEQIMALAGDWDQSAGRGADIAMHPLVNRDQPILLNNTDEKRAEIVRRYRLYSAQPDEMITFRSLSGMKPGRLKLDPRMYQYGGLWIYPVGGLLKLASMLHLVQIRTDLAFYLDHPEAFARFYLVARTYSALWGLLGIAVVYALARECGGQFSVGATAAALFVSMPVVIDLAHEAKPHLGGTVLILLTILAAMRYVRTGLCRWWVFAGIAAGAAMGMVLTGYVAFAVLPVMAIAAERGATKQFQRTVLAGLVGLAAFALLNPYFILNLLFHRQLLHSNVGNYGTFYKPALSIAALKITAVSIMEGTSPGLTVMGVLAFVVIAVRGWQLRRREAKNAPGTAPRPVSRFWFLVVPSVAVVIQMVLLAQGKTAEYGRFALLPDVALSIAAAVLIGSLQMKPRDRDMIAVLLVAGTLFFGARYDANFVRDGRPDSTRRRAAVALDTYSQVAQTLDVFSEPAPYCLPPVDLFTWRIVLVPPAQLTEIPPGSVVVRPIDAEEKLPSGIRRYKSLFEPEPLPSPISWANKPFEILSASRVRISQPAGRP
jgi:hypothetical protein